MSRWWSWRKPEERSSVYSDAIISQIMAAAELSHVNPREGSAARLAADWLGRALSAVELTPLEGGAPFAPVDLQKVGRELVLYGQSLFLLENRRWTPCHPLAEIRTFGPPATWLYTLQIGEQTVRAIGADILNIRFSEDHNRPGKGVPPIATAIARFASALESQLESESKTTTGYLLSLPQGQTSDFDKMADRIKRLRGKLFTYERGGSNYSETGPEKGIGQDIKRLGFTPPVSLESLWRSASSMVLESCGIPSSLIFSSGEGTAKREDLRRCRTLCLEPILRNVGAELAKTGNAHQWRFSGDLANSLTDKARSFASLTRGGMSLSDSAAASGILNQED